MRVTTNHSRARVFTISCKARDLTNKIESLRRLWQSQSLDLVLLALGPRHALRVLTHGHAEAVDWPLREESES